MNIRLPFTFEMKQSFDKGKSVNEVITKTYSSELKEFKDSNKEFQDMSAIKCVLAMNEINPRTDTFNTIKGRLSLPDGNDFLTPAFVIQTLQESIAEENVMQYIVGREYPIEGAMTRYAYLDYKTPENQKAIKMKRVAEGADIEVNKITLQTATIETYKKATGFGATYEAMNDMTIDMVAKAIQATGQDLALQGLADVTTTLYSKSTDIGNTATANVITNKELLSYLIRYQILTGKTCNTIIAPEVFYMQIINMLRPTDMVEGISTRVTFNAPQLKLENITVIRADVPQTNGKETILMFTKSDVMKFITNGSMITEQQAYAKNQTEEVYMSERSSFATFAPYATKRIVSA